MERETADLTRWTGSDNNRKDTNSGHDEENNETMGRLDFGGIRKHFQRVYPTRVSAFIPQNHDYPCAFHPIAAAGRRPGTTEILGVHNLRSEIYGYLCDDRQIKFNNRAPTKKYSLVVSIVCTESTSADIFRSENILYYIFYIIYTIQNFLFFLHL